MRNPITPITRAALVTLLVIAGLAVTGCGSSSGASSEVTMLPQMFPDEFEPACRNYPVEGAAPYDAARPGIHKVVTMEGTDTDELVEGYLDLPSEWTIIFDADSDQYATGELVLCVVRTNATLAQECTGYQSDGEATDNVVNLYSTEYSVSVHEAATGRELGATTIPVTATECPMYVTFTGKTTDWYVTDDGAVTDFARPFVET